MKASKETRKEIAKAVGSLVVMIALFVVAFLMSGCSPRIYPSTEKEHSDSVRIEIRERLVHDTVSYEIPKIVEKNIVKDTISFIENDYAESEARIDKEGFLHHSLSSRPQILRVPVRVVVHDTTVVEKEVTSEITTQVVEVEKELNGWQRFRLRWFWILLASTTGLLIWTFRKQIIKLVRMFI